jgi:hypothetical protein
MAQSNDNLFGSIIVSTCLHVGGMFVLIFGVP